MSLDHFLNLFFRSNVLIIEVLFGLVLMGVIFLTIRSFSRPEEISSAGNLRGIEEGLKKILESYSPTQNGKMEVSVPAVSVEGEGGIMEEMATQIERLKIQLLQKSEEVEQLKAAHGNLESNPTTEAAFFQQASVVASGASGSSTAVSTAKATGNANGNTELEEKIKDLEARLSEYSIIEDDIADLSFYKEETVRLQAEVDKLKEKLAQYESGESVEPVAVENLDSPSNFQSEVATESKPEFTQPQNQTSNSKSIPTPVAAVVDSNSVDDDIMAEFERAVAEQKAVSANQKLATEVPLPVSEEPIVEPVKEAVPEGGINLDKMLDEVGALTESEVDPSLNALEQALDTEKLLQEATGMDKLDTEALNDFDDFLKKEGA